MKYRQSHHRKDENHDGIRDYFRSKGCSVLETHALGHGAPDMIVAKSLQTACVEVKNPNASKSKRRLRPGQVNWRSGWVGLVMTVETTQDADRVIAMLDDWREATEENP